MSDIIPHKNAWKEALVEPSCFFPLPSSKLLNVYKVQHDPHYVNKVLGSSSNDANYWHRFMICNESNSSEYRKNFMLKVITDFVYPCELLPVHVSQKAGNTVFLARNCMEAIVKLCRAKLTVPNPDKPESPFQVIIIKDILTLKHIPVVNIETNINKVLKKRFSNSVLDLSNFHEDTDLQEFSPLSQPKLLLYILSSTEILEYAENRISKIILSHNDIRDLPDFKSLGFRSLKSIDLSNNKIQRIEDIAPLEDVPTLVALQLDGNPLCAHFDDGLSYFLDVKSICRNLNILDNRELIEYGLYKKHKTFLCDMKGFDFANQFLEQYFSYYDESKRSNIGSFYSENAMFSLTYRYLLVDYVVSISYQVGKQFAIRSRNLLNRSFKENRDQLLFCGKDNVVEQLYSLPATQHHPYSFYVDLVAYSETQAIIHVTGVFRIIGHEHEKKRSIYGFTRNFVLSSKDRKEWIITNDQLFVYVPFLYQGVLEAWPEPKSASFFPQPYFNLEHMDSLVLTFESITGMLSENSRKFLETNNWNLELALKDFVDKHKRDEIPNDAFNEKSEEQDKQEEESNGNSVIVIEDDILPPIEALVIDRSASLHPPQSDSTVTSIEHPMTDMSNLPLPSQSTTIMKRQSKQTAGCAPQTQNLVENVTPTAVTPSSISVVGSLTSLTCESPDPPMDELADRVARQPCAADWSPELRKALASLRPSNLPPGRRYRHRFTTRDGRSFRVTLPKGT